MIKLGSGMEVKKSTIRPADPKEARKMARQQERHRLESLMKELNAAIEASQSLAPFKDQLLIDITPAGLRIQIVDKQNRPMFDIGSTSLKPYTTEILNELAKFIAEVPNRISISGHTDTAPYGKANGYTNWELSADRANAARRALIAGGLSDDKVAVVVGLSSSVLFDKENTQAPINRRISIVVMTAEAEAAATGEQSREYSGGSLGEDSDTTIDPTAEPASAVDASAAAAATPAAAQPAAARSH